MNKGDLVPNFHFFDPTGTEHEIWDYRQKFHVVLIHVPGASTDAATHAEAAATHQRLLDWLGARAFISVRPIDGLAPGVHLIDRFGHFLRTLPLGDSTWAVVEKEILYHDAKHC